MCGRQRQWQKDRWPGDGSRYRRHAPGLAAIRPHDRSMRHPRRCSARRSGVAGCRCGRRGRAGVPRMQTRSYLRGVLAETGKPGAFEVATPTSVGAPVRGDDDLHGAVDGSQVRDEPDDHARWPVRCGARGWHLKCEPRGTCCHFRPPSGPDVRPRTDRSTTGTRHGPCSPGWSRPAGSRWPAGLARCRRWTSRSNGSARTSSPGEAPCSGAS